MTFSKKRKGRRSGKNPPIIRGHFKKNNKGFGFITPRNSRFLEDFYVPSSSTRGAMTGDLVEARIKRRGKRMGRMTYAAEITSILERATTMVVGTLVRGDSLPWVVIPDGKKSIDLVAINAETCKGLTAGTKVVVRIDKFPLGAEPSLGSVVEVLGQSGTTEAETAAILRIHKIPQDFSTKAQAQAEAVSRSFEDDDLSDREDLTNMMIVTIDPPTARDFDDAISIERNSDGALVLGIHIADVSHFVRKDSALDAEASLRGTSTYFPHCVVPMLPETLSNGVCSLIPGKNRLTKSVFITYDHLGDILESKMVESVICSKARLTYEEAQAILDGDKTDAGSKVAGLLGEMQRLARIIEQRRTRNGMLHLNLPEVELVLDDALAVVDARPTDDSYTHTIIEMFMVEANEAVARHFASLDVPIIRRIHPDPDEETQSDLHTLLKSSGHYLPKSPGPKDYQRLLAAVSNRPEEYAVNLAILRSFSQARYSIEAEGHFALAGDNYCHFTSPIRRYPDLEVHRALTRFLRHGTQAAQKGTKSGASARSAESCSTTERRAQAAEQELRQVMVLTHLRMHIGECFTGIITGISAGGLFVQHRTFLVEGLLRFEYLGNEYWDISQKYGLVRGDRTGTLYRIGEELEVLIDSIELSKRYLNLACKTRNRAATSGNAKSPRGRQRKGSPRRRPKYRSDEK